MRRGKRHQVRMSGESAGSLNHGIHNLTKLTDTGLEVTGVIHDEGRCIFLCINRNLAGLSPPQFRLVPATIFNDSGKAGSVRDINKHEKLAEVVPASFEHDGRVDDHDIDFRLSPLNLLLNLPTNLGMND